MITSRRRFHRNDTFVALVPLDMQNKRYKPGDVLLKMRRNVTIRMFKQRKIGSKGDPYNIRFFRNYAHKLKRSKNEKDKAEAAKILAAYPNPQSKPIILSPPKNPVVETPVVEGSS